MCHAHAERIGLQPLEARTQPAPPLSVCHAHAEPIGADAWANPDRGSIGGAIQAGRCSRTKADQGVRTKAARTSAGRPGWADQGGRTKTGRPAQADQDQGGADRHGWTGTAAAYTDRGHRPRCPQHTDAAGRRQNRYGLEFRAARTQAVGRPKKGATRLVER